MGCNCGRSRQTITSANVVSDTAGVPTEGARTLAARRAAERITAAMESVNESTATGETAS